MDDTLLKWAYRDLYGFTPEAEAKMREKYKDLPHYEDNTMEILKETEEKEYLALRSLSHELFKIESGDAAIVYDHALEVCKHLRDDTTRGAATDRIVLVREKITREIIPLTIGIKRKGEPWCQHSPDE